MRIGWSQWDTRALGYMGSALCEAGIPVPPVAGAPRPFAGTWQGAPRLEWAGAAWQVVAQGVPRQGSSLFPPPPPIQVAEVSPRLEALRCRAEALARDTAQAESGFTTVKSEKDLQGLQGLLSRQQEMEVRPGEHCGWPCPWWGGVPADWGRPREVLAPGAQVL